MKAKIFLILLLTLALTACGTVDVEQKLYKDGTFDLTLTITSENEMFMSLFTEEAGDLEGATVREVEGGVEYTFEGMDIADETLNDSFSGLWGIEKEFRFPYQYVTLSFDNDVEESPEEDIFGLTPKFYYTLEPFGKITDTNGVYSEDKSKVRFDFMKNEEYFVTFRYFCLVPSWCGDLPEREQSDESFDLGGSEPIDLSGALFDEPSGNVTHMKLNCGFSRDWNLDGEDDGVYLYVAPMDEFDNPIPLEGMATVTANMVNSDYTEADEVYSKTFSLVGEERLDNFDEWFDGYELKLNWSDVAAYDEDAEDAGNVYVTFTDLSGTTYSASHNYSAYDSCLLREDSWW